MHIKWQKPDLFHQVKPREDKALLGETNKPDSLPVSKFLIHFSETYLATDTFIMRVFWGGRGWAGTTVRVITNYYFNKGMTINFNFTFLLKV